MINSVQDTYTLRNGYRIPCVGFGTWLLEDSKPSGEGKTQNTGSTQPVSGGQAAECVRQAVACGFRHIDTAAAYHNERGVGEGVRTCGVPREQIFVTDKVWNTKRGYDKTMATFDKTMQRLGLDYLDLYLIHWPANAKQFSNWEEINVDTWRALTELYEAGRIRAIGVSNFKPHHLRALMECDVKPMVNQIEFHPGMLQQEIRDYCRANDIVVEAYSPLGRGKMLENETLQAIAAHYGKSTAQLCLRWCLQHDVIPLPKSSDPVRMRQNTEIFDFAISDEDMAAIDSLPYIGGSGMDPDTVDW